MKLNVNTAKLRELLYLRQQKVAVAMQVHPNTLQTKLNHPERFKVEDLNRLAEAAGLNLADFVEIG